jgi:tetratricopeptide (TPR) repeat protein
LNEAIDCYQKALKIIPAYVEAHHNLGLAYHKQRSFSKAAASYRKTLDLKPDHVAAHYNMGNIFLDQGDIDGMIPWYQKALSLKPNDAETLNTLGKILQDHGKIKDAQSYFQQALELKPDFAEARFNRSIALLLQGNFLEGFKEYEWRFKIRNSYNVYPYRFEKPCWDGASFVGQRLFVHCEQGLGDTLQFARYLPMVKARGGTVIFETTKPLVDIIENFPGVDKLVEISPHAKTDADFDFYVPLLSLPRIFETTLATAYIFADPGKTGAWQNRLGKHDYKVGIVWAGGAMHIKNKRRSCSLQQFLPLIRIPGVRLCGLQKGTAAAQLKDLSEQIPITNYGEEFETFGDTAAMIANLDLIVTVDTAVAHLAGAMGKPVWVLLPFRPDWRWMLDRQDTPWYPTMRLFRQAKNEDWDGVLQRVADELGKSAAGHREICLDSPGDTLKDQGRLEVPSSRYQQIPVVKPDSAEAYFDLGNAFHRRKNYAQAIACYQKARQHKPEFIEAHYNLGNTYLNQGKFDEATTCYQQALVLSPRYVDLLSAGTGVIPPIC